MIDKELTSNILFSTINNNSDNNDNSNVESCCLSKTEKEFSMDIDDLFLNPNFTRYVVIYWESEDTLQPDKKRITIIINIPDFEIRYPIKTNYSENELFDYKTISRTGWNFAVNTLSEIVSNTGLTPKYLKNDKKLCHLFIKQKLTQPQNNTYDDFFSFELEYITSEDLQMRMNEYNSQTKKYTDGSLLKNRVEQRIQKDLTEEINKIDSLDKVIENLKKELENKIENELKKSKDDEVKVLEHIDTLEGQLKKVEKELHNILSEPERKIRNDFFQEDLELIVKELDEEISELTDKVNTKQAELQQMNGLAGLLHTITRKKKNIKKEIINLQKNLLSKQEELRKKHDELNTLKDDKRCRDEHLNRIADKKNELQAIKDELEKEKIVLQTKLIERNRIEAEYQKSKDELNNKEEEKKKLKSDISERISRISNEVAEELDKEHKFYIASHLNPNEIDPGLLLTVELHTLKEHLDIRCKIHYIITNYILAISKIASDKPFIYKPPKQIYPVKNDKEYEEYTATAVLDNAKESRKSVLSFDLSPK